MQKKIKTLTALLVIFSFFIVTPFSAFAADKLVIESGEGTGVFTVSENGDVYSASRLLANGASAWGTAPFVLGQDTLNRGMVITDKASSNQKNIYFGWNVGETHEYAEIFALQENVGYKNLILNPNGGYVGIGTKSPSQPLYMGSGAYCSTGGVWTNASSREYKTNIKEITREGAFQALIELKPVEFNYKVDSQEKHLGFIAEDVPELVASNDRKGMSPMDVVAVLTKVAKEQQKTIAELSKEMAELKKELRSMKNPTLARIELAD